MENPSNIAVLGLGYVGCVTAACLASLGHRVWGVDRDQHKITEIKNGRAPFYEPGLEDLVRENIHAGRLSVSSSPGTVAGADIALVCVGTPSEKNGNLGLQQLRRAVAEIAEHLPPRETARGRHPKHGFSRDLRRAGAARLRGSPRGERSVASRVSAGGLGGAGFLRANVAGGGRQRQPGGRSTSPIYTGLWASSRPWYLCVPPR